MKHIFIGYILIFFHLKINGFDLLPDFIGYALIAYGLGQMAEDSGYYVEAKPWAVVLTFVAVFTGIMGLFGITYSPAIGVLNLIFSCISLYLMYLIGKGVCEAEQKRTIDMGGEKFTSLWKVQAGLTFSCQVLSLFMSEITLVLASILGVCAMIANIVFLVYVYRAKKALEAPISPGLVNEVAEEESHGEE